jgi:Uma2 family endonuclease
MSSVLKPRRLKLTPADHGREIDPELFEQATGEEGYRYEIIDGRVYVSPTPNMPQADLDSWLYEKLLDYKTAHPRIINHVAAKARVFVHARELATRPEPDVAAYSDYPHHIPRRLRKWQDVMPVLVAEVISENDPGKDLVRNVPLYLDVPTIREYWILDSRPDPDQPTLIVYRRRGHRWMKPITVPYGEVYETPRFLPGFRLLIDPDQ